MSALELYHRRNKDTHLLGAHINSENGEWTQTDSSIGNYIDSYLEYLLKAYFIFPNDKDLQLMFMDLYIHFWDKMSRIHSNQWWTNVQMTNGQPFAIPGFDQGSGFYHDSFASFWPGLLTLMGEFRFPLLFFFFLFVCVCVV